VEIPAQKIACSWLQNFAGRFSDLQIIGTLTVVHEIFEGEFFLFLCKNIDFLIA
jgi:hypothetical protein